MGLPGVISPLEMELWAPTYNWWLNSPPRFFFNSWNSNQTHQVGHFQSIPTKTLQNIAQVDVLDGDLKPFLHKHSES